MAKSVVIVESPAKARTISKYLGKDFRVVASLGHIKDLPKNSLGVDIENGFEPQYEVIAEKKKVVQQLTREASKAKAVYLAADPDREGEAICHHIAEEIRSHAGKNGEPVIYRVTFHEITQRAIKRAFEKPGQIDMNLVEAQQARRVLDRLVGYQVSPLLWDKVRRGLSAGRVQTVALRLVVEREREIQSFVPKEYWTLVARLAGAEPPELLAKLQRRDDEAIEIPDERSAQAIKQAVEGQPFVVRSVKVTEKRRNAPPPFITATLQQEASRKLKLNVKRTMMLAQKLYEGVDLGDEGRLGLITYMRTDSTRVAQEALDEVRQYILETFGESYLPDKPNVFKTKKDAQDAHEAIRPTSVLRTPESVKPYLSKDEYNLYRLIWQRFVASQMPPALFEQTTVDVVVQGKDGHQYLFRATGSVPKFDGFRKVYEEGKDQPDEEDEELKNKLPRVEEGEQLELVELISEQHFTEPPPRYTEATLVKELEADGVGRPSTYATILSTIQERGYVKKVKGRLVPTEVGMVVCDLLVKNFSDLFDVSYTARMEAQLDEIEEGKRSWREVMQEFYKHFSAELDRAAQEMENLKGKEELTDETCPNCGRKLVKRWGRHGSFLACSGYPECKYTRNVVTPEADASLAEEDGREAAEAPTCPNCGRPMILKQGRYGKFFACSGYPECRTTQRVGAPQKPDELLDEQCPDCGAQLVKRWGRYGQFVTCSQFPKCKYVRKKTIAVKCPQCKEGEITERRTKRGKLFYGCTRYPDCNFMSWKRPIEDTCPECGAEYLVERQEKEGPVAACPNCSYKRSLRESEVLATT